MGQEGGGGGQWAVGSLYELIAGGQLESWPGQAQNAFRIEKWNFTYLAGDGDR